MIALYRNFFLLNNRNKKTWRSWAFCPCDDYYVQTHKSDSHEVSIVTREPYKMPTKEAEFH